MSKLNLNKFPPNVTLHGLTFSPKERLFQFAKNEKITVEFAQKWADYEGLQGLKDLVRQAIEESDGVC